MQQAGIEMTVHPTLLVEVLILIAFANGAPLIAKKMLRTRFAWPIDGGALFFDHHPVLGPSKTIRGLIFALAVVSASAWLMGLGPTLGLTIAFAAMLGDLISSFLKRRLHRPPSSRATGLDQIPESLLPLFICKVMLGFTVLDIAIGVAAFFIGEILLARIFYRFGLRDTPY